MKRILMACLVLLAVGCERQAAVEPAENPRELADKAISELLSNDFWRRSEATSRERLRSSVQPGDVAEASVDLQTTTRNREEESSWDALAALQAATKGKPPYYPAVEGFRSALEMADVQESWRLRALSLDQVVEEFGVDAQ
jgi:hypothetical protein